MTDVKQGCIQEMLLDKAEEVVRTPKVSLRTVVEACQASDISRKFNGDLVDEEADRDGAEHEENVV